MALHDWQRMFRWRWRRLQRRSRRQPVLVGTAVGVPLLVGVALPGLARLWPEPAPAPDQQARFEQLMEQVLSQPGAATRSRETRRPEAAPAAAAPVPSARTAPDLQAPAAPARASRLMIRVALAVGAPALSVGGSREVYLTQDNGRILATLPANQAMRATVTPDGIRLGDLPPTRALWLQPAGQGLVAVDGRWYHGKLKLIATDGGLLAVNYVDLEQYLAGVVTAEMPASWPQEALKAQAIAARSYAIVHMARPASREYDLGATPRWQAYGGVASESDAGRQAIATTRGLLLSYRGGIVESLYAATDQLVVEAHGHLGASMSQHGARELAEQGYRYGQILSRYYRGAQLARLNF